MLNLSEKFHVLAARFVEAGLDHPHLFARLAFDEAGNVRRAAVLSPATPCAADGEPDQHALAGLRLMNTLLADGMSLLDAMRFRPDPDATGRWLRAVVEFSQHNAPAKDGFIRNLASASAATCRRMAEAVKAAARSADA